MRQRRARAAPRSGPSLAVSQADKALYEAKVLGRNRVATSRDGEMG